MKLLTKAIEKKLRANAEKQIETGDGDFAPALKLFNPTGAGTWLITELHEDGSMFGLCDVGHGTPELGYVSLQELQEFRGRFGLGIERDMHFEADKTIGEYAEEARSAGHIKA